MTSKLRSIVVPVLVLALLVAFSGCENRKQQVELELRRSFKMFLDACEKRDLERLKAVVYFPGVTDYEDHVRQLQLNYLEDAQSEKQFVTFDEQGVVLGRFLGLMHHTYEVIDMEVNEDETEAKMRISVNFAYDNNISYNVSKVDYEPGTRIFIPGEPWGKVIIITLGGEIPSPREQLKHIEIDMEFRKTNYEGVWQLRKCVADQSSIEYEFTIKENF